MKNRKTKEEQETGQEEEVASKMVGAGDIGVDYDLGYQRR